MKNLDTKRRYTEALLSAASRGCLWSHNGLARQARVSTNTMSALSSGKTKAPQKHIACALTCTTLRQLETEIHRREAEIAELQRYRTDLIAAHTELYGGLRGDGTC